LGRFQAYAISNHLGGQMKNHRAGAPLGMQGFLKKSYKGGDHRGARKKFEQNCKEGSEHY
jgi:hypothetical protein